jgi:4-hydroxy-tetrahydrodipicolinate synthase
LQGDLVKARKLHYDLLKVTQLFFTDGNPGGVKVALETQKLCAAYLRLPLYPVNESIAKSIKSETKKLAR